MDIRPIRTEADYDWALAELAPYFETEPLVGTAEGDRFEVLSTLVEAYEARVWPLPDCDPVDLLSYAIEEMGHTQSELADLVGSRSHTSEVLARKRPLSLEMIRRISEAWGLPADLLLTRYPLRDVA